jgi:glycosyltransferase involved in cell wall biosynthesis
MQEIKTLIVPMHNEEKRWDQIFWLDLVSEPEVRLIFVDDGSSDGTVEILKNFCAANRNASFVSCKSNLGKAEAVRYGVLHLFASKDFGNVLTYGYLDGDCAISKTEVLRLTELARDHFVKSSLTQENGYQVISVWSSRVALSGRTILRRKNRHYISRVLISLIGSFYPEIPYDSQCGFKLFRNHPDLNQIFRSEFKTKWFFDLEIHKRMRDSGFTSHSIREEPLDDWHEVEGSHITIATYPSLLFEIFRIIRILGNQDQIKSKNSLGLLGESD